MKKLQRTLSLPGAIAVSIGGMLSGIFVLPGLAVGITGSSVWLAFLVAALCILPAVLSKSELATSMPKSGGTYVYIERAFGPLFGTISGLGLWLSLLLKSAFSLVGLSAYLYVLIEVDSSLTKSIALFSLLLILLLNIFGVKKVEKTQLLIVSISVLSLVGLIIFGFGSFDSALTEPVFSKESSGFISAVAFLYISYAGVTKVAAVAGEIKNPEVNLPKTMLISLFLITVVYVLVAIVLVGNVEASLLVNDIKPIYTLSQTLGGDAFGYAAGIVGVLTLLSMANSGVLASSRFPFAMARDKMLPDFLGSVSAKFMTPVYSIVVTAFMIGLAIIYLDIEKIAKLASAFKVLMFISVNLAVIVLRETNAQWYNPSYKSPFYPYVQIFGVISGVVLLAYLGLLPLLSVLGVFVFGFITFLFYGRKTNRKGVFSSYGIFSFLFRSGKGSVEEYGVDVSSGEENVVNKNAEIVVPLLGEETSPETLVEIASSIKDGVKLNAINLIEAPNQTFLEAVNTHSPRSESIKRRILNIKPLNKTGLTYETVSTHNVSNSIENITGQRKCKWLVMGWEGRTRSGILIGNPIGWLLRNVNSSFALYKDNGVRSFEKIVLALRPGRQNRAFIKVAENICAFYGAELTLLNIVPSGASQDSINKVSDSSSKLISKTKCNSSLLVLESDNPLETITEQSANFDLLILGTPEKDNWLNVLFGGGRDKFVHNSVCSVLRLTIK
ncbi:amino acid permease [Flavobacteriaceae bacterium]|jgi:APA family basic amino acid/polyamine antiporter|nr:amino acid permease [Flavobacteriaceae bacterium]